MLLGGWAGTGTVAVGNSRFVGRGPVLNVRVLPIWTIMPKGETVS